MLNNSSVSKFVTKKWIKVNGLSSGQYSFNKNLRFKTSMLRSDLCDFSDVFCDHIVAEGKITVGGDNDDKTRNKKLVFKNNHLDHAYQKSIISKISNAEDLDIASPMYNLL